MTLRFCCHLVLKTVLSDSTTTGLLEVRELPPEISMCLHTCLQWHPVIRSCFPVLCANKRKHFPFLKASLLFFYLMEGAIHQTPPSRPEIWNRRIKQATNNLGTTYSWPRCSRHILWVIVDKASLLWESARDEKIRLFLLWSLQDPSGHFMPNFYHTYIIHTVQHHFISLLWGHFPNKIIKQDQGLNCTSLSAMAVTLLESSCVVIISI